MNRRQKAAIPAPVVRRMTRYLAHAWRRREEGVEWVSSQGIADALGVTSSTVRQDLSHLEFSGTSKRGYETKKLELALYKELGADRVTNVAIVGAGNLGRALALHGAFERSGFIVRGIFDSDPKAIGRRIGKLTVLGMEQLPRVVADKQIDVAMIAVPEASAQQVADELVSAGVGGLLHLARAPIRVPPEVAVVEVRIVSSLQELLYLMKGRRRKKV